MHRYAWNCLCSTQLRMEFQLLIKTKMLKKKDIFCFQTPRCCIYHAMPTIDDVFTFMSVINFMLSCIEHEKNSGPDLLLPHCSWWKEATSFTPSTDTASMHDLTCSQYTLNTLNTKRGVSWVATPFSVKLQSRAKKSALSLQGFSYTVNYMIIYYAKLNISTCHCCKYSPLLKQLKGYTKISCSSSTTNIGVKLHLYLSRDMRFPTIWHFDKCRLGRASAASF